MGERIDGQIEVRTLLDHDVEEGARTHGMPFSLSAEAGDGRCLDWAAPAVLDWDSYCAVHFGFGDEASRGQLDQGHVHEHAVLLACA